MIELKTKGYCQNCPEFEPDVESISVEDLYGGYTVDQYVMCKHRCRCESIANFIRKEIQRAATDKTLKDNALTEDQREDCRRAAESFHRLP